MILEHLGGETFLTGLGARDFIADENGVTFTLGRDNPGKIHSVSITDEGHGRYKVTCYGRISPGSFHAPVRATEIVAIAENLASVLGRLTGIEALQHRHL